MEEQKERADLNSVIFDFDSIMDIKVGAVLLIQNMVARKELSDIFFDMELLNNDRNFFKRYHVSQPKDVFKSIFNTTMAEEDISSIYNDLLIKYHDNKLITTSPLTNVSKLIQAYAKAAEGAVKEAVLCKSQAEKQYIEKNFPGTPIVMCSSRSEADILRFSRLVVGDIHTIEDFGLLKGKHFLVLGYADNFSSISIGKNNTKFNVLNPDIIMKYGDINEFEVIEPYDIVEAVG